MVLPAPVPVTRSRDFPVLHLGPDRPMAGARANVPAQGAETVPANVTFSVMGDTRITRWEIAS